MTRKRTLTRSDQLQTLSPVSGTESGSPRHSILFRLVDLASQTLEQCAPAKGHLATRYAHFLRRLADGIASGSPRIPMAAENNPSQLGPSSTLQIEGEHSTGGPIWDGNWLTLLQNSGLPDWPFDS